MRLALCLASLSFAACASVPSASPAQTTIAIRENRFSIYLGQRNLDEDDYDPVDEQGTLGFEFSQEKVDSAIGWEVGLMGSGSDEDVGAIDVEGRTAELYGGVRKSFGDNVVRPYIGGGLSFINSEIEVSGAGSDDDTSLAGYAHGGISVALSEAFLLGLDLRILFGSDLEIGGVDTDADYGQLALFMAFGF